MKMTEYPAVSSMTEDNILILDGDNGTKKVFVGDAILAMLHLTSPQLHRMIYRGKNLGSALTTAQKAAIQNGTFDDLWLGDYWVINDVTWRIVDFNYWALCGDTGYPGNHLVIMPDTSLYAAQMNTSNVTTGGYVGSAMYTSNLANAKTIVANAFGDAVISHREYLTNAVTNGYPSGGAWCDSTVELPNEIMMYGCHVHAAGGDGSIVPARHTVNKTQLALFTVCPKFIHNRQTFWLRDVVSAAYFAVVYYVGDADCHVASSSFGVRPVFALG